MKLVAALTAATLLATAGVASAAPAVATRRRRQARPGRAGLAPLARVSRSATGRGTRTLAALLGGKLLKPAQQIPGYAAMVVGTQDERVALSVTDAANGGDPDGGYVKLLEKVFC